MTITLHVFGAAGCVTGSCMLLETSTARVLIDCGMFHGPKTLKQLNYGPFPFDPAKIDALCLTHAHIDHSGLIPKLYVAGYRGPIYATAGTTALCGVMLPDAGAIQEMEVDHLNRRDRRRARAAVEPIYTREDSEQCLTLFQDVPYQQWRQVAPGVRARWWDAGHILGSASIEVEAADGAKTQRLLFSGDLGPGGRDFSEDPQGPAGVDHMILESTYGDVARPRFNQAARRAALRAEALAAHAAGGPLLIPAFAVERTQELLVDLLAMMEANEAPPAPIFLDSPLAIRASNIFLRHGGKDSPFSRLRESAWLQFTESAAESRALERVRGWHVIVSASGMCDAGRVRHHLRRLLWRSEATVLLVGYQAIGSLGRLLQEGRQSVRIQGDDIKVRARMRTLDVYSGHADADGLVAWARARAPIGGSILLTHGEPDNLEGLKRRLTAAGVADGRVVVTELDQRYRLQSALAEATPAAPAPRIAPRAASRLDWHNARSDFLGRLNDALDAAPDDETRERLLNELRARLPS
jgi:metallo-beta-lactamase family protein